MAARTCEVGKMDKQTSNQLLYSERFPESRIPKTCFLNTSSGNQKAGRNFVLPQSPVLDRVRDLLPKMKKANEELMEKWAEDPQSVSLEVPEDSTERHIEMECFLIEDVSSDSSDSDESDTEEEEEEVVATAVTEATLKVQRANHKRSATLISEIEAPPCKVQATTCRYFTRSVARRQRQQNLH